MIRQNDPCDEWPKAAVLRTAGLQPCGCPLVPHLCRCVDQAGVAHAQRSLLGISPGTFDTGRQVERAPMAE